MSLPGGNGVSIAGDWDPDDDLFPCGAGGIVVGAILLLAYYKWLERRRAP